MWHMVGRILKQLALPRQHMCFEADLVQTWYSCVTNIARKNQHIAETHTRTSGARTPTAGHSISHGQDSTLPPLMLPEQAQTLIQERQLESPAAGFMAASEQCPSMQLTLYKQLMIVCADGC